MKLKNIMTKKFHLSIFIIILSLLFTSCSLIFHTKTETKEIKDIVIYPSPPDTARIQFLTRISRPSDIIINNQNWFNKFILGRNNEVFKISKPSGIAIHNGKIYICDKKSAGLGIIDLEKNSSENFIPKGRGALRQPFSCFVDTSGFLYVVDPIRREVVIFDKKKNYLNSIGDSAKNFKPMDVFVYDNKIWVADMNGKKIKVYSDDSTNKLLYSFPHSEPTEKDFLFAPTNVFVANGKVYVTDFGDFRIKIYSTEGKFLNSIGENGDRIGTFAKPKGVAVDSELIIYVVDAAFENVQMFNKEGQVLMDFGGHYDGPGGLWIPSKIAIDYDNLKYFQRFVDPGFELKNLIFVTNQFGPDKIYTSETGSKENGNGKRGRKTN